MVSQVQNHYPSIDVKVTESLLKNKKNALLLWRDSEQNTVPLVL